MTISKKTSAAPTVSARAQNGVLSFDRNKNFNFIIWIIKG